MSNKVGLLLAGGVGLYLLSTTAANATQAIGKLSVRGAKIKKIVLNGLFNIDVQLELMINNPGSISIPFEYYTGSITHAGSKISDFQFNGNGKNVQLTARSVTPVTFNLNIGTINIVTKLVNLVKDIIAGKKVDTVFKISSSLYAGGFDLPVNFTHDIKPNVISGIGSLRTFNEKLAAFAAKRRAKLLQARNPKNWIDGIAGVKATLEFKSNKDMENYFGRRGNDLLFYKN